MATISRKRKTEIDLEVQNLQLRTGISYPHTQSIIDITQKIGIIVKESDFANQDEYKGVRGIVEYENRKIIVDSSLEEGAKTYTVAYELGHLLLHDKTGVYIDYYVLPDDKASQQNAIEADYFASNLLMPKEEFTHYANLAYPEIDTLLSDYFGVSLIAVKNRRDSLNLNAV